MAVLWTVTTRYELEPFELEAHFEEAVKEVAAALFGPNRIYLDVKKKIGAKGKNIKSRMATWSTFRARRGQPSMWWRTNWPGTTHFGISPYRFSKCPYLSSPSRTRSRR